MKSFLGCCLLLCLLSVRVQTKPQVTKLFPIEELPTNDQLETSTEFKPLDKLFGKLRATYDFVFRKRDNASNIEKIPSKDASHSDGETLEVIWKNPMNPTLRSKADFNSLENAKQRVHQTKVKTLYETPRYDRYEEFQPLERLEPLPSLEFEDEAEDKRDDDVEFVTQGTTLPTTLGRHFVEWLYSLLGLTYGIYAKLTRAIHGSNYTLH